MPSPTLVKICGTTSRTDAQMATAAGADFIGSIVDFPTSPRHISLSSAIEIARSIETPQVAVTVNQSQEHLLQIHAELRPAALQLHGDESPDLVMALKRRDITVWVACSGSPEKVLHKAYRMQSAGADAILVDARVSTSSGIVYGGTGHTADWEVARQLVMEFESTPTRVILAGGLTPENVGDAIRQVCPWMVDVVTGVEAKKGLKDPAKVTDFVNNVRTLTAVE